MNGTDATPGADPAIVLYGADWCPDCRRSKRFLSEQRIPFTYVDLEATPEATAEVERRNDGKRIIPTIVFGDGSHVAEPSNAELADALGLPREAVAETYDVVIVGGGPTGLTAAIYTARENLRTLVVDRSALGGQAGVTERLDNYPGFPEGVAGAELAERMVAQAKRYGVELLQAVDVASLASADGSVAVSLATGQRLLAGAALVATGSTYRRTGASGEDDLIGAGVHFCATCDGPFYADADEVLVIGGGNSGLEEGLFLTQFADHVTVVEYADQLAGSRLLQDKVRAHPKMSVRTSTEVVAFEADADGRFAGVRLRDRTTGDEADHEASGAFVFVGLDPNSQWLDETVSTDARGFITTDRTFATSMPGVYAAGDVRAGSTKQLASAVGEGAAAALQMRYHLDGLASVPA